MIKKIWGWDALGVHRKCEDAFCDSLNIVALKGSHPSWTTAHELGHAFGLGHNNEKNTLMSISMKSVCTVDGNCFLLDYDKAGQLLAEEAEHLSNHPWFQGELFSVDDARKTTTMWGKLKSKH